MKSILLPLVALLSFAPLSAATKAAAPAPAHPTVPAFLLSDIHLDPFHDPAKFQQLRDTPATGWAAIPPAPAPPNRLPNRSAAR